MALPDDDPDQWLRSWCFVLLKNPELLEQKEFNVLLPITFQIIQRFIELVPRKAVSGKMATRLVDESRAKYPDWPMAKVYKLVGRLTGKTSDAVRKDYERHVAARCRQDN